MKKNRLYFGDCLDILKELHNEHPNGFIDLIYIDPPFNSKRDYNVLFETLDLTDTKAQKQAFSDTWSSISYIDTLNQIYDLNLDLYQLLKTLDKLNLSKSIISYLTTISIRIYYIHKILKDTGSFYLHCDPTMSHYLKIVCDLIFRAKNFRNEIIWKRAFAKKGSQFKMKKLANNTDIILFYGKSKNIYFETPKIILPTKELIQKYNRIDENGKRFKSEPLELPKRMARPNLIFEFKGYTPKYGWMMNKEKLEKLDKKNKIYFTRGGKPRRKNFLDDYEGTEIDNIWVDIPPIGHSNDDKLGYPTQKPEALLERIIKASSNKGDLIADFFCGCGTTVTVAERLKRNWIGVDISHLAIKLILDRLIKPYKNKEKRVKIRDNIEVNGFPKDIASAKELAKHTKKGRIKFQDWIIEVMLGGVSNPKKSADGGYDGYITFYKTEKQKEIVLIEVKSGKLGVKNIREFIQVINRQEADMGIFVCFEEYLTKPMLLEAKQEGYYSDEFHYDKIQIITIEDLLDDKMPQIPESIISTFKQATKKFEEDNQQIDLTSS